MNRLSVTMAAVIGQLHQPLLASTVTGKAKSQELLTFQVSSYRLLALLGSTVTGLILTPLCLIPRILGSVLTHSAAGSLKSNDEKR